MFTDLKSFSLANSATNIGKIITIENFTTHLKRVATLPCDLSLITTSVVLETLSFKRQSSEVSGVVGFLTMTLLQISQRICGGKFLKIGECLTKLLP